MNPILFLSDCVTGSLYTFFLSSMHAASLIHPFMNWMLDVWQYSRISYRKNVITKTDQLTD